MKTFLLTGSLALCIWGNCATAQLTYQITPEQIQAYPKISSCLGYALGMWNEQAQLKLGILQSGDEPDFKVIITDIQAPPLTRGKNVLAVTIGIGHGIIYVDSELESQRLLYIEDSIAHEVGHSIGLDHSSDSLSIMYYMNDRRRTELTSEDIERARVALNLMPKTGKL